MAVNMDEWIVENVHMEIPIIGIRDGNLRRGYHFFHQVWQPTIGEVHIGAHEDNPIALVKDKYAISMKTQNGMTVGHVPLFMSKFTYFFIRHGGSVKGRVSGERRYCRNLTQE